MTPNRLIFGRDESVAAWVARQLPVVGPQGFGPCRAVAIVNGDRPLGAVVYSQYHPEFGTIQMSIATTSRFWAQTQTVRDLLAIPFVQYKCNRVWATVAADNERSQKFCSKIGMVREAVLRHQFGRGRNAWVYGMLAHEYAARWGEKVAA